MQISAERERQELATELARQVEENKRLRKSLLAQSTKFLSLRQSNDNADLSTSIDPRATPVREYSSKINRSFLFFSSRSRVHNQCPLAAE